MLIVLLPFPGTSRDLREGPSLPLSITHESPGTNKVKKCQAEI